MTMSAPKKYNVNQSPFYKLGNKKKLASILNLSSFKSLKAMTRLENPYRIFDVPIKNKLKSVQVPSRELYTIHARLFILFRRIELPDYLHSGIKGRSYITNAKAHLGTKKTYTLDIVKFYPSVSRTKVAAFFRDTMKCSKDVAAVVAHLSTCDDHIPTGSSLSQLLAYLACKKMFDELYAASLLANVVMTCYVDDLTFSGDALSRAWIYNTIKPIITKHGLKSHKDKFFGPDRPKEITGVIVDGNKVKVCNRLHKSIHELMLQIPDTDDLESLNKLYDTLIGKLSAAAQIEEKFKIKRVKATKRRRLGHPVKCNRVPLF
jgi:Peduoviridae polymerase